MFGALFMKISDKMMEIERRQSKKRDYNILQLLVMSIIVGLVAGGVSIIFNLILERSIGIIVSLNIIGDRNKILILPMLGGLFLSWLYTYKIDEQHRKFGVAEVWYELRKINEFVMRPRQVFLKTIGTLVTLATGFSAGRQGPIVNIGGAIGSNIGYTMNFKKRQIKILIGCGVAGAVAGAFNEPIFASIFVLEVLLKRDYIEHSGPVFMSAVSASILRKVTVGDSHMFNVGTFIGRLSVSELPMIILLGIICGLVAGIYIYSIKRLGSIHEKFNIPFTYRPAIAGVIIGVTGYLIPENFDLYFGTTERIMQEQFTLVFLLALIVVKIVTTAITLGSGGIGGGFMPGIFIGCATGGAFALGFRGLYGMDYYTYAFLGMAGMFSGFGCAPLSATLLAVEIMGDNGLVIPIFLVCIISSVVTEFIMKQNLYINFREGFDS